MFSYRTALIRLVCGLCLFACGGGSAEAAKCTVSTTPIVFGTYNVFTTAPSDSTATLVYNCNGGARNVVVAITRGGMAPAMIVARELDIRTVDTISVKSYDHQNQSEARVLKAPDAALMGDGTGILIVDDLVDSGKTLELVRALFPKAHFATVYAKPKGRPQVQTFITEVSQDTWIFFPWDMALQYVEPYRGKD